MKLAAKREMNLERRRHRIFLTNNTEYHVRDRECVGVRDRRTKRWLVGHAALRGTLLGGIYDTTQFSEVPRLGSRMVFALPDRDVLTSTLVGESRPDRVAPEHYTFRTKCGIIDLAA